MPHPAGVTQPLALILYEKLLPGSQLVNRLQDLGYRVEALSDAKELLTCAEQERPLLVLADLVSTKNNVCEAIARLKRHEPTQHLPVLAFCAEDETQLMKAAADAGAALVVSEVAVTTHLESLMDRALQVE